MRRLLALVVLAASTTFALTTPAHAGGPTSVLITDPGSGHAAALYYSDRAYTYLDGMIAGSVPLDGEPDDLGARSINLTWLVHDVSPWRTQQLYTDAAGGPVVATYDAEGAGAGQATWRRVGRGKAVVALLDQLLKPGAEPDLTAVDAAPAAVEPVVTERVVTETAWWSLAGWRWLVLGVLVGAGAALLVVRRRPQETGPRQVLVDLEPGAEALSR